MNVAVHKLSRRDALILIYQGAPYLVFLAHLNPSSDCGGAGTRNSRYRDRRVESIN